MSPVKGLSSTTTEMQKQLGMEEKKQWKNAGSLGYLQSARSISWETLVDVIAHTICKVTLTAKPKDWIVLGLSFLKFT